MSSEVRIRLGAGADRIHREGTAIDLRDTDVSTAMLRTAIAEVERTDDGGGLVADCPPPSRWWSTLADPTDDHGVVDRLVAAARSRGCRVPEERELAAAERRLATQTVEPVDVSATRERLAESGENVARLRERVATVRGRLQARKEVGADTTEVEATLEETMTELSEAETDRVAAEQAHERAERRARDARSARERRLRLEDRVANCRRDARRALVETVSDDFAAAVGRLPGEASLSTAPLSVTGDRATAALTAIAVADLGAPVLDTTDRFPSAARAAAVLETPVIRC